MLAVVAALLVLLWIFQSQNIRNGVRWLRVGEMWVASKFEDKNEIVYVMPGTLRQAPRQLTRAQVYELAKALPKEKLNSSFMTMMAETALKPFRIIFTALLVLCGLYVLINGLKASIVNAMTSIRC